MISLPNEDFEQLKLIFTKLGVILQHADYSVEEQALIARQERMIAPLRTAEKTQFTTPQFAHIEEGSDDMQKLKFGAGSITRRQTTRKDGTIRRFYEGRIYRNGKQVSVYGTTQAECLAKLKELRDEIEKEKRQYAKLRKSVPNAFENKCVFRTYGEWLDEWVKQFKEGKLREDYYEEFVRKVATIKEALGGLQLKKIEPLELLRYLNSLPRSNSTVKKYDIINGSLQKAEDFGIIKHNPCKAIERPTYDAQKRRAFELEEQTAILSTLNERYSKAFFFICCTGLRIGEFLALEQRDVDFQNHYIKVDSSRSLKTGKDKETKTVAGVRKVYFADELFEVFEITKLGTFTYNGIKKAFKQAYEKLGIEGVSATHSCRHTFSSMLYAVKVSDKVIQKLCGHADVATTMKTYTHILMKGESPLLDYIRKLKSTLINTLTLE